MIQKKKLGLTGRILIGMVTGIALGVLLQLIFPGNEFINKYITLGLMNIGGKIFVTSLKMLVVPLVFVSLVCGVSSLRDPAMLGRLGSKTLVLYLGTTALAVSVAIGFALLFKPGSGMHLDTTQSFNAAEAPALSDVIINMFPSNPIEALASGNMLQIIVFALLFGAAIALSGEAGKRVAGIFDDFNTVIMKLVTILMNLAPYGVFCLLTKLFSTIEFKAIMELLIYFVVVLLALIAHAVINYSIILKVLSGLSPLIFLGKMKDAIMFAFSTSSSNATIPVTLETVQKKMGVGSSTSSFTIPLGATINMDGTSIMQGVATVFIATVYDIDLSVGDYLLVVVTATLASLGTAGVPGVGLITLAMVLQQVGLPVDGIALIIGVDRLLDMTRTAVNITGDCMVTCIVAKSEGDMSLSVFNDLDAAEDEEEVHLSDLAEEMHHQHQE